MEKVQPVAPATSTSESIIDKESARKKFLFKQLTTPLTATGITFWEELTCVGYNSREHRLEGIVSIKQNSGYSGTVCNPNSSEYVRFFVDFKDGSGFRDMGYSSFKACDIPDTPAAHHPLMYMTHLSIDDDKYRRFLDCNKAVIPTVRGILSWNVVPPSNPNYIPFYGNVKNVSVQLERKKFIIWKDLFEMLKVKPNLELQELLPPQQEQFKLPPPPPPDVESIYKSYKSTGVPDHRTFYSTIAPLVTSKATFIKASPFSLNDVSKLKVDMENLAELFANGNNKADVTFEELGCVGLNTVTDTLGAVLHVKKPSGFNGNLCQKGSMEHVAFWADWDDDGTYDEYLGTVSLEVHDISNIPADGLFYNVALPINVSKHLRKCANPNVIKVRGVLSWESLPSTTDPNHLNYWGNRVDSLVQLRPGHDSGVHSKLTFVGGVDRQDIDPFNYLYNYTAIAPTIYNNRPWGGSVEFQGIIDRNGFNGVVKYRLLFKKFGASDLTFAPVSTSESFLMFNFGTFTEFSDPQNAPDGWFVYKQNPTIGLYNETNHLAWWSTGGLTDGTYTIRLVYTDEFGVEQIGDEFSMIVNNKPMTVSPTANAAVDMGFDMDDIIVGGDCHSYDHNNHLINGAIRAIHPYFASWSLTLEPASHTHSTIPSPASRSYSSLADTGDSNLPWTLDTQHLDPCGYTVSLLATTRVILNSSTVFPQYGPKAVGFAVLS